MIGNSQINVEFLGPLIAKRSPIVWDDALGNLKITLDILSDEVGGLFLDDVGQSLNFHLLNEIVDIHDCIFHLLLFSKHGSNEINLPHKGSSL